MTRSLFIQSGDVYMKMLDDFMRSQKDDIEFLLDRYRALIYDGNFDIICNHSGNLAMFDAMTEWEGAEEYYNAENKERVELIRS